MHKETPGFKRKRVEVPPQPPTLPAVSPGGILELLVVQKNRAEELLKSDFLSIEDVRYWNLFTKEILTKAFGEQPEYINAVIYAGEEKPYSAFEPESNLEKMRRRNFEIALKRLGACMRKLNPESSKADPPEEEEMDDPEEDEYESAEPRGGRRNGRGGDEIASGKERSEIGCRRAAGKIPAEGVHPPRCG